GFSSGACERCFCAWLVFGLAWDCCPSESLFDPLESRNSILEAFTFVISRLLPSLSWNLSTFSEPSTPIFEPFAQYCLNSLDVLPHASNLIKFVVSFLNLSLTIKYIIYTNVIPLCS